MWKDLSLKEKSAMMKVAIANGITDLNEIQNSYNKYANGGPFDKNKVYNRVKGDNFDSNSSSVGSSLKQYFFDSDKSVDNYIKEYKGLINKYKNLSREQLQQKYYEHYNKFKENITKLGLEEARNQNNFTTLLEIQKVLNADNVLLHEDAKDFYLQLPQRSGSVIPSNYTPAVSNNKNSKYYTFKQLRDKEYQKYIIEAGDALKSNNIRNIQEGNKILGEPLTLPKTINESPLTKKLNENLGIAQIPFFNNATISKGIDDKGEYYSVYDIWDYNTSVLGKPGDNIGKWIGGKPFELYDRIYLDDYYGIDSSVPKDDYYGGYLPKITVTPKNKFAEGGPMRMPLFKDEKGVLHAPYLDEKGRYNVDMGTLDDLVITGRKREKPSTLEKIKTAFNNATIGAAMAENPSVMQASGWSQDNKGNWKQERTKGSDELANDLAVLSMSSPTHPITAATDWAIGAGLNLGKNYLLFKKFIKNNKNSINDSSLDWSPQSWFGEAAGRKNWTTEDEKILASHVPEYREIEKTSKINGTWLKMKDGSTWQGDPRSWVQMQSKNGKYLDDKIYYHGDDNIYIDDSGINTTEEMLGKRLIWGNTNPKVARTYTTSDNRVIPLTIDKNAKLGKTIDAEGRSWKEAYKNYNSYSDTNDFSLKYLDNDNYLTIKNVVDPGPLDISKNSKYYTPSTPSEGVSEYFNRGFLGDDVIIGKNVKRKSLLGNNGNFNWDLTNPFKSIIIPIIGLDTIYNKD